MGEKSMKEIIHENYLKERKKELIRMKQRQRKEKILATFIGVFIVIMTVTVLILDSKLQESALKNCANRGHSENYCLNHV